MIKKFSLLLVFLVFHTSFSQNIEEKCNLEKSYFEDIFRVDVNDVKCIAQNSDKLNTILMTYARWCAPCIYHLSDYMNIEKLYNADLYVILMDDENSRMTYLAKELIQRDYPTAKILIIKDIKGKGKKKKYKDFLTEITPPQFENINDMSKYIVLNKDNEVVFVSNYKNHEGQKDWKDGKPLIKEYILPLLQKKETSLKSN